MTGHQYDEKALYGLSTAKTIIMCFNIANTECLETYNKEVGKQLV